MKNFSSVFKKSGIATLLIFGVCVINFAIAGGDEGEGGPTCRDYCIDSDFRTCNLSAQDANGDPITVICHYKTKK